MKLAERLQEVRAKIAVLAAEEARLVTELTSEIEGPATPLATRPGQKGRARHGEAKLALLRLLREGEATTSDLIQRSGFRKPSVTANLRLLCEAKRIVRVKHGTYKIAEAAK